MTVDRLLTVYITTIHQKNHVNHSVIAASLDMHTCNTKIRKQLKSILYYLNENQLKEPLGMTSIFVFSFVMK